MCKKFLKYIKQYDNNTLLVISTFLLFIATAFLFIATLFLVIFSSKQTEILDKQTKIMGEIKIPNKADLIISPLDGSIIKRSLYIEGGNELFLLLVNTGRIPSGNIRYWYGGDKDITLSDWETIKNLDPGDYNKTKIRMKKDCKENLETCDIDLGRIYKLKINFHCDLCKPQNDYYEVPICFYEEDQECNKKLINS